MDPKYSSKTKGITYYLNELTRYSIRYSFYKTNYVVTFNYGFKDASEAMYRRESFGEGCQLRFVDENFCVPKEYDVVLSAK